MKLTWCVLGFSTLLEAVIISPSTSLLIIPKGIIGILMNLTLWTYCQPSCPTVQLANCQHDYEVKGNFLKLIFIGVKLTYNVVLVFVVQQSELVTHTSIHHPSFIKDSYPTWVITEYWEEFPVVYSRSLLVIYFIYTNGLLSVSCSVSSNYFRPHGTVAHQAPLSMEFSRQEYWSGLSFPSPGNISDAGSPALQADSLSSEPLWKPNSFSESIKIYLPR